MKKLALASVLLLFSSCLQTFQPLSTERTTVFEPGLLGTWSEDSTERWMFAKGKDRGYEVRLIRDGSIVGEFTARLVQLKKYFFLDLFPAPLFESENQRSTYAFHFLQVHTISRLRLSADTLQLSTLDHDWFTRGIKSGTVSLPYVKRDEQVLVTASTAELQKFVVRYAENTGAFPAGGHFLRAR